MVIQFSNLFWYLYQVHTFNNNLNNEEMIMCYENFFMIKTSCLRKKNNNRKTLAKHVT